jgi:alcohol dehydrogenase (cytochrome c)
MTPKKLIVTTAIAAMPVLLGGATQLDWGSKTPKPIPGPAANDQVAQGGLDPSLLLKPLADTWTSYSGDYTGRRYSSLNQITTANVKGLTLAWTTRLNVGSAAGGGGSGFGGRGAGGGAPMIVGGEGTGDFPSGGGVNVKGAILAVDNVLYVTSPNNTWALDAHDGRVLWQYFWKTRGGTEIGNRGAALWHEYLFFETPDNFLVSLDAKTGKERWHVEIADFNQQYFSTMAPMVIGDQVLVGTGNDLDAPGFLQSYDPMTGHRKWIFYTVPMKAGDPGLDTWPSLEAARHGGGQVWLPGVYDPETKLYIFGTGNPTPGYTGVGRRGDNLFTCALIAVNVETGKMAWYYQTSPHDTHDWDSAQTPVLIDTTIQGKPRKLVSTAARNGYFFTVDRVTGEAIVTERYGSASNWIKGETPKGNPIPDPGKEATIPGSLVSPVEAGVTNWPPPAYSPDTGLFYVNESNGFNILYLTDPDPRGSMGLGGKTVATVGSAGSYLTAIDPKTGKVAWRYPYPGVNGAGGAGGLLTTGGGLLIGGDAGGNFVARDAKTGKPLWHSRIGSTSNAPQTYTVDGTQHVLVAVGDTLYAFTIYDRTAGANR